MKITEGNLEFDFDDQFWSHVIKFDEHPDYLKVKNLVPETRGVDFAGILSESTFVAIEVKDFRGSKTQENNRLEPLEIEIAKKVVGTLATTCAGCRTSNSDEILWKAYNELIQNREKRVFIILWHEADPIPPTQKRLLAKRAALGQALKNKLAWLGCKTLVTNSTEYDVNALKLKVI